MAIQTFIDVNDVMVGVVATAALATGAYAFFRFQLGPSYRLLRLFRAGRREGQWHRVAGRLLSILARAPSAIMRQRSLFKRVRMEIEFECLNPRPVRAVRQSRGAFVAGLRGWRASRRKLIEAERETVAVAHPGVIHDQFEDLDRYFDALQVMQRTKSELRFSTKVHIEDGFVAPIHLVSGVLRKFDAEWEKIIETYEFDHNQLTRNDADNDTLMALKQVREIQKFIFDCWLQWGPSIPLCSAHCQNFAGGWSSLQYGYGDENQSVELVGTRAHLTAYWQGLTPRPGVLAARAAVTGHLASSRFFEQTDLADRVGPALATSWRADEDGRILVLLSERDSDLTAEKEGQAVATVEDKKVGAVEPHNAAAFYYSAYLWAIFVILRQKIDPTSAGPIWVPANREPDVGRASASPWLDFIPFFEHGNIADPETFWFMKRQLAEKAVAGLEKIVRDSRAFANGGAGAYPLRFAFACSLDHSGCGCNAEFLDCRVDDARGLKALMRALVAKSEVLAGIVLFDEYDAAHPHASCTLPASVDAYFEHVREVESARPG